MTSSRTPKILLATGLAIALLAAGALLTLRQHTSNSEAVRLYLPSETSYAALCDSLHSSSLGTPFPFRLMSHLRGLDQQTTTGSYRIAPQTSWLAVAQMFYRKQQSPIRLTIGKFRLPSQLDEFLNNRLMNNNFSISIEQFHLIRPDTYELYWTLTPDSFLQRMRKEYDRFWERRSLQNLQSQYPTLFSQSDSLSQDELFRRVIILASIVEEETNYNPEKPLIASVYLNRLQQGIPLQADPTVKYALGDFGLRRILNQHLKADSPYNTYLHRGLPPAPICLPSAASVDAVLAAKNSNLLYFCASPEMNGQHLFAATLAEHNRNAARFHSALNARGIK